MNVQIPDDEVRRFLGAYMAAFAAVDGERIAGLYHSPSITVRADGAVHSLAKEGLAPFFQAVADTYHRDGCRGWRYLDLQVVPIGARSLLASLDWEMLREDGSVMRRWRQSYVLQRVDADCRILASIFHQS